MLNSQIGAKKSWNGQYTVDCSTVPDLPNLDLYFDGKAYPLKGSDYVLEVQGTCISSFTPMDIPGGLWIIGTSSLNSNVSQADNNPLDDYRRCFPQALLYGLRSQPSCCRFCEICNFLLVLQRYSKSCFSSSNK
jgi:hypothetical protein